VAGKDIGTPFRTFLDQPGVPMVEAQVKCDGSPRIQLRQSRFLPIGSTGSARETWQIPVCVRYEVNHAAKEACTLLTSREGSLPLDACPQWVHPNADGAGYYRFSLTSTDLRNLQKQGFSHLSIGEKMALGASLRAGFLRGTTPGAEVIEALFPFASDPHPLVADEPMGLISTAREWLYADALLPKVQQYARELYARRAKALSWDVPKEANAPPEQAVLRQRILGFLARTARDPAVRAEAAKRGRAYVGYGTDGKLHPEAVDPDLGWLALAVALEDAEPALFEAVVSRLGTTDDEIVRGRLFAGLGAARTPGLAARARELALDPRVRKTETLSTLWSQLSDVRTRDEAWSWVQDHIDALIEKISPARAGGLPHLAASYCDEEHAKQLEALFSARAAQLDGGPRNLALATESIRLCAARRAAQEPSVRAFFAAKR
jgi:cytosol alanyl aminopeptidase